MIRQHLRTHRKKYVLSTSIALGIVLIMYIYMRISAALHFGLQTELLATHSPAQLVTSASNNETVTLSVKTSIETFHACESLCDYSVDDIYSLKNQSQAELTHKFTIKTQTSGFGQQLHYFKSSCKTIPSTFCPSSKKAINQTSLLIINYNLRPAEEKVVKTQENIEMILQNATKQVEQLRYAKQLFMLWPQQNLIIADDKKISAQITDLVKSWKQEDYLRVGELTEDINETSVTVNEPEVLLANIEAFNQLREEITVFLRNETMQEFISYAQNYDTNAGTIKQAVTRLTTILSQTYIEDLARSKNIALGAMQFLESKVQNYSSDKNQAQLAVSRARILLQLIETPLINLPLDLCNATDALAIHNEWAQLSNFTQLTLNDTYTLVQSINATHIFSLPTEFCKQNKIPLQIQLDHNPSYKQIKIPLPINLSAPKLNKPAPHCFVDNVPTSCVIEGSPILFIHGHSFDSSNSPQITLAAFNHIQELLENEGYINAGELVSDTQTSILPPITMRASFYFIQQYDLGSYSFEIQKSERIENYALRLKEIIDDVKRLNNASNVTIIAHSMGGLVVREYVNLFGMDSLDHVITINTPHQGITGRTASVCDILGSQKECEDMTANSTFLKRLPPISGNWDVIASTGCQMSDGEGDGVVLLKNSILPNANYHLINGTCTDALNSNLHTSVLEEDTLYQMLRPLLSLTQESLIVN